jgi:hypothetical protein
MKLLHENPVLAVTLFWIACGFWASFGCLVLRWGNVAEDPDPRVAAFASTRSIVLHFFMGPFGALHFFTLLTGG